MKKQVTRQNEAAGQTRFEIPPPKYRDITRTQVILVALVLVGATTLAYMRALNSEFVYLDDRMYVTENAMVLHGLTWEGVRWAFTSIQASNWHPLTWLSHMLDNSLYGQNPRG